MLIELKAFLISVLYLFGGTFMLLYPPRNYELSGAKMRAVRNVEGQQLRYRTYLSYQGLREWAHRLARNEGEVVTMRYLTPSTAENRSIIALELRSDRYSKKPSILVVGALNAMSWGATNAIVELAEKLIYDSNYQTPFFNDYDWYIIPMANPDGVEFTKAMGKLPPIDAMVWSRNLTARPQRRPHEWHKNVDRDDQKNVCFGTNVNRNFAFHWQDDVRKTPERCSQYYPGAVPFSSAEARAIHSYLNKIGDVISLSIHLHASYAYKKEFILYPWRYSQRQQSNYRSLQAIGEYAARMARLPDGRLYEVHQSSNDKRVAGSLSDFVSGVVGTDLVYLIKPYHKPFPSASDNKTLETYVWQAINTILSLVRGWRSSTKQNTLSFFGKDIEF